MRVCLKYLRIPVLGYRGHPTEVTIYLTVPVRATYKVTWDIQHTIYMTLYISSYTPKSPASSRPSAVSVSQNGQDSVLVSWTPPSGGPDVTGYIIHYWYYYRFCESLWFSENAEATATNATITGLIAGVTYGISMVVTSSTLPNYRTGELTVTIGTVNIHKLRTIIIIM